MHNYFPRTPDTGKCLVCSYSEKQHGDQAECDTCGAIGKHDMHLLGKTSAVMCAECWNKEVEHRKTAQAQKTAEILDKAPGKLMRRMEDNLINSTDIFNAELQTLPELKQEVESDDSIPANKKHYAYAERVKERLIRYQSTLLELHQQQQELQTKKRALQQTLNQLANTITAEEREKLKLADINYKPNQVTDKSAKTPRAPKVANDNSWNAPMKVVTAVATKHGLVPELLKNIMNVRKIGPEEAAEFLKNMMAAAMKQHNGQQ